MLNIVFFPRFRDLNKVLLTTTWTAEAFRVPVLVGRVVDQMRTVAVAMRVASRTTERPL